jgi:hypothetical protein
LQFAGLLSRQCAKNNRDWANSPRAILPAISLVGDKRRREALRLGSTQLGYRFKAAAFFAMPHLYAELREYELVKYQGFAPTVENLAVLAGHRMGWDSDRDGTSTIKGRIWGPSRPVVHAAAILFADGKARGYSIMENPESWLPYLKDPKLLLPVLLISEIARRVLPRVKQFRIKEADTIEFLP